MILKIFFPPTSNATAAPSDRFGVIRRGLERNRIKSGRTSAGNQAEDQPNAFATMKLPLAAFAVLAIASTAVPTVTAFPSGAGSCAEGEDKFPPASQHADKGRGTLADGGLKVWLGNVNLEEGLVGEGQLFTPVGICTGDFNDETGYNLCELCQGDCDNDAECAPGLACFNRNEDEDVPGCYGLAVSNRDYCYVPEEPEEPDVVVPDEPVPAPTEGDAALAPTTGDVDVEEEDAEPTPAPTPEGTEETTEETTEEETVADTGKWAGVLPRACGDQCREECEECCNESNEVRNLDNCLTNIAACADNDPCDGAVADADAAAETAEPTPAPTPEETEEVTEEETEEVTEEGTDEAPPLEDGAPDEGDLDVVDFGDCTDDPEELCPLCQGDCDADSNCQDGLFCFQRDDDEDVPGCRGRARDGLDYCIPEFYRDSVRNLKKATTPSAGGALRNNKTKQVAKNVKKKNESRKLQGDAIEFQTTRTYTLWLEGTFKGFLFRLSGAEGQDLSDVFETTVDDTQIMPSTGEKVGIPNVEPGSCAVGVSGACHTNNEDKEFAQVDMTIPGSAAGELELEVTAMVDKDNWYQTTYTIIAQDVANLEIPEQPVLTAAPVAAPTQAAAEPTMAASEPTVAALAPTAGADLVAPEPTAAEVLPDGAVRLPSTGVEGETEFQPVGQCSGPTGLCMQCEGDCDNDGECGDGFVCYQRVANEPVPFCYGVAMVDRDYCSLPVGATTSPGARSVASRLAASVIVLGLGVMFA